MRAIALVAAVPSGPDLHEWVRRAAVVVSIGTGDIDGAVRAAEAMADPFWAPVARARLDLALGDATGAAQHLADAVPRCPRHHVVRDLLLARAAPDEAVARVAQAVELAATHGMLRTVVVDGRELIDAIEQAAWRVPAEWLQRLRSAMAPIGLEQRRSRPGTSPRCSPIASATCCACSPAG